MSTARQRLAEQRRKAQHRDRIINAIVATVVAVLLAGLIALDLVLRSNGIYF